MPRPNGISRLCELEIDTEPRLRSRICECDAGVDRVVRDVVVSNGAVLALVASS